MVWKWCGNGVVLVRFQKNLLSHKKTQEPTD
jgi:hypothetical protein